MTERESRAKALEEAVKVWGHAAFYGGKTANVLGILTIVDAFDYYLISGNYIHESVSVADKTLDELLNGKITPQTNANPTYYRSPTLDLSERGFRERADAAEQSEPPSSSGSDACPDDSDPRLGPYHRVKCPKSP